MDRQKTFYLFSETWGIIRLGEGEEEGIWTFGWMDMQFIQRRSNLREDEFIFGSEMPWDN